MKQLMERNSIQKQKQLIMKKLAISLNGQTMFLVVVVTGAVMLLPVLSPMSGKSNDVRRINYGYKA